jgi:hypothetical protein
MSVISNPLLPLLPVVSSPSIDREPTNPSKQQSAPTPTKPSSEPVPTQKQQESTRTPTELDSAILTFIDQLRLLVSEGYHGQQSTVATLVSLTRLLIGTGTDIEADVVHLAQMTATLTDVYLLRNVWTKINRHIASCYQQQFPSNIHLPSVGPTPRSLPQSFTGARPDQLLDAFDDNDHTPLRMSLSDVYHPTLTSDDLDAVDLVNRRQLALCLITPSTHHWQPPMSRYLAICCAHLTRDSMADTLCTDPLFLRVIESLATEWCSPTVRSIERSLTQQQSDAILKIPREYLEALLDSRPSDLQGLPVLFHQFHGRQRIAYIKWVLLKQQQKQTPKQ